MKNDKFTGFALLGFLPLLAWLALPAAAAAPTGGTVTLDIPAQQLGDALSAFAQQSGLQILFQAEVTETRMAPAVAGKLTAVAALEKLLANTSLEYEFVDERTVAIRERGTGESKTSASGIHGGAEAMRMATSGSAVADGSSSRPSESGGEVQPGASNGTAGEPLEEIIVTAQKREERLTDVPMSISVLSAGEIDRRRLVSAEDYLRGIPGVNQVTDAVFGGAVVIRGIETTPRAQNYQTGATTATYFGETPTTNSAGLAGGANIDIKLVDIERVEVLRGPQGTAFGNSSLGGAVRTIPVAPKLDGFGAKVGTNYSHTAGTGGENYMAQAIANVPLIKDKLAARAVVYRFGDSGFYTNVAGSDPAVQAIAVQRGAQAFAVNDTEVGSSTFTGARLAALFQATDNLKFTLSYLTQKTEIDGQPLARSGTYEQAVLQVAPEHRIRGQAGGANDTDIDLGNAVMQYQFGWADLLATYSHIESGAKFALTYAPYNLPYGELGVGDHREDSGEIRLLTHLSGPLNFLGGLYAENLKDTIDFNDVWYGSLASIPLGFGSQRLLGTQRDQRELTQKAAFAETYWHPIQSLTLTGGVRAYDYNRARTVSSTGYFGNPLAKNTADASGTNFRANVSYKLENDTLIYAGWSQGFRLGRPQNPVSRAVCDPNGDGIVDGTNITVAQTTILNSDSVDNYELGAKTALFDRRMTLSADVYQINWTGVPVQVRLPCNRSYLTNAGSARSNGVEFQASVLLAPPLRLDFGGSWTHARLTEAVPAVNAAEGARLAGSPKFNANLSMQYSFNVGTHPALLRADAIYVGSFYGNFQQLPETEAGGYTKLDLTARVTIKKLNVDLFAQNLTNEDAFTFRGIFAGQGSLFGYRLRPRTIGMQLGYAF